jgi:hypothetical protein
LGSALVGEDILPPSFAIEVGREEEARVVRSKGVNTDRLTAEKMPLDDPLAQREKSPAGRIGDSGRRVSLLAQTQIFPEFGIHITASAKELKEEGDLFGRSENGLWTGALAEKIEQGFRLGRESLEVPLLGLSLSPERIDVPLQLCNGLRSTNVFAQT